VAHRGDSRHAPENSLEAVRRAVTAGAHMVEVDAQLGAGGDLLVFHDRDARRLTGTPGDLETMDPGLVRELRLRGSAESVPALGELLDAVPPGFPVNVELKRYVASRRRIADAILEQIADRPTILVSSFDWLLLRALAERAARLPVAPLTDRDPGGVLAAADTLGAWSVHVHRRVVDDALIAAARRAGRPVLVYTVDDGVAARRLFGQGVSGVFANDPGRLLRALGERGAGGEP